jgi:hypothetical protein
VPNFAQRLCVHVLHWDLFEAQLVVNIRIVCKDARDGDAYLLGDEGQYCDFALCFHAWRNGETCAEDERAVAARDGVELVGGAFGEKGDVEIFILEIEMLHDEFPDDVDRRLFGPVGFAAEEIFLPREAGLLDVAEKWCFHVSGGLMWWLRYRVMCANKKKSVWKEGAVMSKRI